MSELAHTRVQTGVSPGMETAQAGASARLATISGRLLFGTLLLVLAMSPFEAGYRPVGRFLWATFTNLEAAIFLLAGAWAFKMAVDAQARARLLKLQLRLPIIALVAACVLSTAFGEYKAMGPHFIYRLLMGVLVFASSWEALASVRRLLLALLTPVAAGLIAAVFGLLEFVPGINMEHVLSVFKPQPTTVGGMLRLSGSFEYANGAAMYFEMALAVLLGLIMLFSSRGYVAELLGADRLSERARLAVQVAMLLAASTFAIALILTFSRAAWIGTVFAACIIGAVPLLRRRSDGERAGAGLVPRPLAVAAIVMLLGATYVSISQPLLWLRLKGENDRGWYKSIISAGEIPPMSSGDLVAVPVTVRNDGPVVWQADGAPIVHLSYHWMSPDKRSYLLYEGARTTLPHDLQPGESVTVNANVLAPVKPGDYYLQWDLVQENVTWFSLKSGISGEPSRHSISAGTTSPNPAGTAPSEMPAPMNVKSITESDTSTVPREQLWKVALAMFQAHPITGVGPDAFRDLYGKYAGVAEWNRNIYTNNTYIEMFTNLGLVGGLSFLWLAGLAMWRASRRVLRERVGALWLISLGATAALFAFFLHGFADYFLFSTPIYVLFWFLLAASLSRAGHEAHISMTNRKVE